MRWSRHSADGPGWTETLGLVEEGLGRYDAFFEGWMRRYSRYGATKVGGWPAWIQEPIAIDEEFVFQVSSEEKPRFMVGDNGKLYVYRRDDGEWLMTWDFHPDTRAYQASAHDDALVPVLGGRLLLVFS